jgi:ArsR family transcriptional regulator
VKKLPLKELVELYRAFADPVRLRLLGLVLGASELRVSEICAALRLPQSTVSRQLGRLRAAGLLRVRREGTSAWYSLRRYELLESAGLSESLFQALSQCPELRQDLERLASLRSPEQRE